MTDNLKKECEHHKFLFCEKCSNPIKSQEVSNLIFIHKEEALAYSPSVNIIRKILAKHITEWSNEMLCELANSIDLEVKNREAELIEEIEESIPKFTIDTDEDNVDFIKDLKSNGCLVRGDEKVKRYLFDVIIEVKSLLTKLKNHDPL